MRGPRLDPNHPANRGVLRELRKGSAGVRPIVAPSEAHDPYYECGVHPDCVGRLWDQLGAKLPGEARCLVYGQPALVHPVSGVILGLGMGTAYVLRIPDGQLSKALAAGCLQKIEWGGASGDFTNLSELYGADWVFGAWLDEEVDWCRTMYRQFDRATAAEDTMLTSATSAEPVAAAGTMVLEVLETPDGELRQVAIDPNAETIERAVRSLAWKRLTFVILKKDDDNYIEGSGSLDPGDGFSATYVEEGVEHIADGGPENLDVIIALLISYQAGDDKWRTLITWD